MNYLDNNQISAPENGKKRYLTIGSALILLVMFFVLAAGFFWWLNNCNFSFKCTSTQNISNVEIGGDLIKKNETVVKLTAQVVKKQLDSLLTVGSFYGGRRDLVQLIQQDKWQQAVNLTSGIFKEFPDGTVYKITFADITGTAKATVPLDDKTIGQNFAFRDWYRGLTKDFKPYISETFQEISVPRFNVVGIAFPVNDSRGMPVAILLLQIKTDTFLKWLSDVRFGNTGLTYIVDQRGHVVAHPDLPTQAEIIDYSSKTEVQKVVAGQSGTEISFGPQNQRILASYEPITDFHWGVITRIELDEAIGSGLVKDNLGQIQGGGGR